jgi:crotonobetainyl-CoA:carnitine CoA-transferase CaiB-like acyl-CoA transferase
VTTPAEGALAGFRVLDLTGVMAGPFATRMLADHGADVIKVEPPGGDLMRTRPPLREGHSSYFGALNCGKRSIVLDLKSPDGRAIATRLAQAVDIVVENFRPGVVAKLGLDYETLAAHNPGLIYCSISGFGQSGPAAAKPAYAPVIHAASGYDLANQGYQSAERPARTGIFLADVLGGIYAFGAIQAALLHRERTGAGQAIDVSMLDAMVALQVFELQRAQFPSDWRRPVYSPLQAADGYVVVAPTSPRIFERLCRAIDRTELSDDPRFSSLEQRDLNWDQLLGEIEKWTCTRTASESEQALLSAGVPCSRYRDIAEVLTDEHVVGRGSLAEIRDEAGDFLVANPPYVMSATPARARPFVSAASADSEQILQELLGCTTDEISAWQACGALGSQPLENP